MSRIGKLPVAIPAGVKIDVSGTTVKVEGPKGKLEKTFNSAVVIAVEDDQIKVSPADATRFANAMYGTARSIISNMVQGVVEGFSKDLEISGVGFQANLKGKVLNLKLGYSHDCNYDIPEGVTITVDGNTKVKVSGIDKHMVGQAAASIKKFAPIEPYKGKGVRIVGEHVIRKEGKSV
ncbi:50S ribosomal protein L6 [Pelagicoccus sp. SDUM812002]|uniref:50S ribosomal protein L6 n=1 Tax=Pelagicoccus sp. SDUM812002 TaxID=3041266 RepID=UPI00280C6653|nr:50S ribosomal protein L6 [Pelagicoccus sp. SDUM812002]MDQ8187213.1 50S ribosomal protein L6 [Pelagicoccus sp. SDUM812002]